eukprot:9019337-Alexandrium_andersonii.AAC.1
MRGNGNQCSTVASAITRTTELKELEIGKRNSVRTTYATSCASNALTRASTGQHTQDERPTR